VNKHPDVPANSGNPDGPSAPTSTARGRRARKRGNGEGTIFKRADGRYTAGIFVTRPDGTRGRKWIYGRTRAAVAAELARLAQRVEAGAVVPTRSPNLSEYLTYWLTDVITPSRRPTTVAKYRTAIELYLRPGLGHHRLDKLTVATVQRYLNGRRAAGDSVAKLEMIKVVLSSALSRAMREELVARNVAQLTTLPVEHRARRTAWTAAQARVFLRAAAEDPAYPVFVLALVYGLRRGEIAALRWEDVDFTGGRIFVRASLVRVDGRLVRGPVKSAAGVRALPLVALSRAALIAARDRQTEQRTAAGMLEHVTDWHETGYVFTTRSGRPIEPRNLSRSFDRIVTTAGLPNIVFHDLRRTAATMLKSLGVPARDAQTILGHANIAVTLGVYSEVFDSEIATALGRINDALGGGSGDGTPNGEPADEAPRRPLAGGSSAEKS
jgi:integrase